MSWTKSNATKHSHPVVFGRRIDGCPRCAELSAGAEPIRWNIDRQKFMEMDRINAIRNHDCKRDGCGPVCVKFDW